MFLVKHSVDLMDIIVSTLHSVLDVMDDVAVIYPTVPKTEYFEEDTKPPISMNKSKQQRFTCDICNFEFRSKNTFYNHKKIVHLGVKIPCPNCDRSFTLNQTLKKHINREHQNAKYECDICKNTLPSRA